MKGTLAFWYYLNRCSIWQSAYCLWWGIRNCTVTAHEHFAQRVGEKASRIRNVSERGQYPVHSPVYYWEVKRREDACLLLAFAWHLSAPVSAKHLKPSNFAHWIFYHDGVLYHSCVLHPEASADKCTLIAYGQRRDLLTEKERQPFDSLLNPDCRASQVVDQLCAVVKTTMLSNVDFAEAIDQTVFDPKLACVHRTYCASAMPNWSAIFQ